MSLLNLQPRGVGALQSYLAERQMAARNGMRRKIAAAIRKHADSPSMYSTAKDYLGHFWDDYKRRDGFFWHPSKSVKDNFRGYAETGGEVVGGTLGAAGGFVGGGLSGGPAAPVTSLGGATAGGYWGGKTGKSIGRNAFNYVTGAQQGQDSFGRNTGLGITSDNGRNDFVASGIGDIAYLMPGLGGVLTTPVKQMPKHLSNLFGKRNIQTPLYESLPWTTRYAYGPNTKLHPYVDLSKPVNAKDLPRWQHGRTANTGAGQFSGTSNLADGTRIPDRNLRYQAAKAIDPESVRMDRLHATLQPKADTQSFLRSQGIPSDSARRLLDNKGEYAATMGDRFNYGSSNLPESLKVSKSRLVRIPNGDFTDVRTMSDQQAARYALGGTRQVNGKKVPLVKEDGTSPAYSGINADTVQNEVNRHPSNPNLRKWIVYLKQLRDQSRQHGEITVPISKLPSQGYTQFKQKQPVEADNRGYSYYPWLMKDETPPQDILQHLRRTGLGAPLSQTDQQRQ